MYKNQKTHSNPKEPIKVISFIKVEPGKTNSIIHILRTVDSVKKILSITGNYDIIVELQATTTDQLYEEFTKRVDVIPGVREIQSNYIMKSWSKGGNDNDY